MNERITDAIPKKILLFWIDKINNIYENKIIDKTKRIGKYWAIATDVNAGKIAVSIIEE